MLRKPRGLLILGLLALSAALVGACAAPLNFTDAAGPRYAGCCPAPARPAPASGLHANVSSPLASELRVVTFNIKYGERIAEAGELLEHAPDLKGADFVFLQEMDAAGVRRLAARLGMCYVYYPATVHPKTRRLFGPAILSRWPLSGDHKVILPHLGRFGRTERIAVGATASVRGLPIRVYSVHVATGIEVGPGGRRDQIGALLADASSRRYRRVIIGGDLNAKGLGKLVADGGYEWPTRDLGRTSQFADVDHIFVRGLEVRSGLAVGDMKVALAAGKVTDNLGASDHKPVWVALALPRTARPGVDGPVAGIRPSDARVPAHPAARFSERP